jgi:hypothetical protein
MNPHEIPPTTTVAVEGFPTEARVAEPLRARISVATQPARDLRGATVEIRDAAGVALATATLIAFDGTANRSDDLTLTAPAADGVHALSVVVPAQSIRGAALSEASTSATLTTRPRAIHANAWGLPPAPVAGSPCTAWVGAKGASDVAMAGRPFVVRDADDVVVAEGTFGTEPYPGTSALYAAQVDLPTPSEPGVRRFVLSVPGFAAPIAHAQAQHPFTVATIPEPDARIVVTVIDHERRAPLPGALVVAHPQRVQAGADGVAHVALPRGEHLLFVSAPGYDLFRYPLTVDGDAEVTAELLPEIIPDVADQYV